MPNKNPATPTEATLPTWMSHVQRRVELVAQLEAFDRQDAKIKAELAEKGIALGTNEEERYRNERRAKQKDRRARKDLKRRYLKPGDDGERLFRNRFLRNGSGVTVALAMTAELENRQSEDGNGFVTDAVGELDTSSLYRALVNQAYHDLEGYDQTSGLIDAHPLLRKDATLFVAGMIAERNARRRRRQRRALLKHVQAVRQGREELPTSLVEKLP